MSGPRALLFATFFALGVGLRTPTSPLQPRSKTAQPPVAFGYSSALTARGERDWLDQRYEASSSGSTKLPSALSDRDDDALLRNAVIAATAAQERRASPLEASDPERQPTAPPRAVQPMRARLDDAQARLLRAHMLLVFKIARRYAGRGVSEADLTQEGALGLLHAMRKFDPTRGVKFVTYAYYWVHTFVARAVDRESSLIRVPHHAAHRRRLIARLCAEIVAERGAEPTDAELAKAAGCTLNAVRLARNMPQVTSLDAALYPTDASYARDVSSDASRARSLGSNARTLSAVHDEDDAFTCVVDDEFGKCGSDERAARIDALLEHALQPHEQQIVRMHYGLGNALYAPRARVRPSPAANLLAASAWHAATHSTSPVHDNRASGSEHAYPHVPRARQDRARIAEPRKHRATRSRPLCPALTSALAHAVATSLPAAAPLPPQADAPERHLPRAQHEQLRAAPCAGKSPRRAAQVVHGHVPLAGRRAAALARPLRARDRRAARADRRAPPPRRRRSCEARAAAALRCLARPHNVHVDTGERLTASPPT
jgi:RNA polymerase sigma factor (sigma-70 family)